MHVKNLVVAVLLLAACGPSEIPVEANPPTAERSKPAGAPATPEMKRDTAFTIVILGDSLTAGFGLAPSEALPEQIEEDLVAAGFDVSLINAGVSGDTSAGGLARYDWSVASAEPDLLVVALGANDYLGGVDHVRTRANLAAIVEQAQADSLPVILASVEPRSSTESDPRAAAYAAIYPDLSEAYGIPLYRGLVADIRDRPALLQRDGLHPTAEGVEIMAERLSAFIAGYLPTE